jgi:DNA-binding NarL/FixJ family response regulator
VSEGASNRGGTIEIGATGLDPLPASVTTDGSDSIALLSAKEWQILKLVAEGKTNKEIAAVQFVEVSTVKTHLNNIYGKLSVNNRKEARAKYAEFAPKWPVMG